MFLRNLCDFPGLADGGAAIAGANAAPWDTPFDVYNNAPPVKRTGMYQGDGCFHATLNAQISRYLGWDNNTGNSMAGTALTEIWAGCMLNTGSGRSTDTRMRHLQLLGPSRGQSMSISQTTAGLFQVRNNSSAATTSGTVTAALSKWYLTEVHAVITNTSTGAGTMDLRVTDPATGKVFDSVTGVAFTNTGLTNWGGIWFGTINTASVTFSTGWDIDVCYLHNDPAVGYLGLYPYDSVGVPINP